MPAAALVLSAAAAAWFWYQAKTWPTSGLDSRVYREAAQALVGRDSIYSGRFADLPFTYPPFALLLFVPLALVPSGFATAAMFGASVVSLVMVVRWCQDYVTGGRTGAWGFTLMLAALASVCVEPVRITLGLGQVNLLLLALVVGVDARATRLAGMGAGLATAVKVTPGLLIVAQGVRGDRRALLRGVLSLLAATGAAAVVAPASTWTYFTSLLWDSARPGDLDALPNQSWRGLVARHFPDQAVAVWLSVALLILALGAAGVRRHRRDPFFALTVAAITGLLVSPISWSHHWVWVLPCVAVGLRRGWRTPLAWASAGLLLATLTEALFWTSGEAPVPTQDIYVVVGLVWLVSATVQPAAPDRA